VLNKHYTKCNTDMEFKVLFITGKTKSFKTERGMRNFIARKSNDMNNGIVMYGMAKYINLFINK
jgi:hypothetical protein